jgi:hypothetical protein
MSWGAARCYPRPALPGPWKLALAMPWGLWPTPTVLELKETAAEAWAASASAASTASTDGNPMRDMPADPTGSGMGPVGIDPH